MSSTSEDYNPTIEKRGSTLVINEENMRNVPSWSGNVSWSLRIPDGLEVRHNAGGGGVSVAGLRVNLEMNTGSGHFEMTDYEGKVKVNAGSGDSGTKLIVLFFCRVAARENGNLVGTQALFPPSRKSHSHLAQDAVLTSARCAPI